MRKQDFDISHMNYFGLSSVFLCSFYCAIRGLAASA